MTQFYCSLIAGLAHIMTVKTNLILSLLFIVSLLQAQSFTEIPSPTPFPRVERGSVAVADINGDSLIDVLITGQNDNFQSIAQLYLQDEVGNFTLMPNTPFEGVSHSTAVFADVNGNTYPDLLITGENSDDEPITKLYINDGEGNFIERMDTPFIGVAEGSIGFADVNEDSYPDVLITGRSTDNENDRLARLYTNDGTGIFSEMADTPFTPVVRGSVAFGDINGDNFADVFITGRVDPGTRIAELYVNDGTGNFSIVEEVPFAGVEEGVGVMVDVNGDSFLDVFIAGVFGRPQLYTNDGNGIFTELTDTPFLSSFSLVSAAFSDVNGDTFADLLIAGRASSLSRTQLYTNDGTGNFKLVEDTPFAGATSGAMVFQDINGDDHTDLFLIGNDEEFFPLAAYYTGDGTGQFAEVRNIPEAITDGSVAFADVNGDNYPDLIVTGESLAEDAVTVLYTNDGTGQFTAITNSPLDSVEDSSIAFADVNGNNYPDVLITGRNSNFERIAKLYTNDGAGNFTEVGDTPFAGVNNGAVAFADVNGDTYLDLLITGDNSSLGRIAQLYINDGTGIFSEVANVPFTGVEYGAIAFADINEDTHLDVLITGEDGNSTPITQLFTNDGTGSFTEMPNVPFEQVAFGSIAFADVNNDTYPDVLITGENAESDAVSVLYTNDGTGDFTEVADTPFEAVENSSIAFADIDNNSTPDVLITGKSRAKLYTNMEGVFTEVVDTPFDGVDRSSVAIADINNDNFVDVLITGEASGLGTPSAKLYLNNGVITSVAESGSDQSLQTLLFPNPSNNGGINLRQQAKKNGYLNIRLLDSSGRMLNTQQKWLVAGQNNLLLEYQNLPSGVYYLHLNDGRHSGVSKMIVH